MWRYFVRVCRHLRKSSRAFLIWMALLQAFPPAADAHEIRPAIADLTLSGAELRLEIRLTAEALLARIDLTAVTDTNAAEGNAEYDRLRILPPEEIRRLLREDWPRLARKITVMAGDMAVDLTLNRVTVAAIGNARLPRDTGLSLSGTLPDDGSPIRIGWDADLGALVIRETGPEELAYTGYLSGGDLTPPLPRTGGAAAGRVGVLIDYIGIGFTHIVPKGLDHVLFVLGLFLLSPKPGPLLWQVTAFGVAHTLTLALGILGIVTVPANIVGPLIAASIVYVGIENVFSRNMPPWRPVVVFVFGLLHGLGFASVLEEVGLPPTAFFTGLAGFSIGVELGLLAVLALALLLVGLPFRNHDRRRISIPASLVIAAIGAWWTMERIFL